MEAGWYAWWEESGFFKPRDDDFESEKFIMVISGGRVRVSLG